jgi:arabinofuranan 3-O-arabinosyltransferase
LTMAASLWWLSGLWAQGNYGIDILRYTETVKTVAKTSIAPEALRGLSYWFFYGRDKLGPWIEANLDYTQVIGKIAISYTLPVLALVAAVCTRWKYRAYFVFLVLMGTAIAVGAHPYDHPSPFGGFLKGFADSSQAGLALRSTGRAVPLIVLGLAVLLGAGVNAAWDWLQGRDLNRLAWAAVGMVGVLAALNLPALWNGHYYGENLQRPEDIPQYWKEAAGYLDAQDHDTRVMELPGADFASYQWGNTVDPITPGLMDRGYVARELIPYGSPASADLLNAFDRRLQESVLDRDSVAPIARIMAVGDVVLRNDLQNQRYNTPRPTLLWRQFSPIPPPGLEQVETFGTIPKGPSQFPLLDEQALVLPPGTPEGPAVGVFNVTDQLPIVRARSARNPVIIAGDGEGLVDAAAVGLIGARPVVFYSGSFAQDPQFLRSQNDSMLVVTDSNRKRARRWSGVRDNTGYTERADEDPMVDDPTDNRLPVFPDADTDAQSVTDQRGAQVEATAYGNSVSYTPEDRAARAFDGDLLTAWKVGAFANVGGERIVLHLDDPITTDHVNLVQPQNGPRDRWITEATLRFDGQDPIKIKLGDASRTPSGQSFEFPKRTFSTLSIQVDQTNIGTLVDYIGVSAVGFAEVRVRDDAPGSEDVRIEEVVRMPLDLLDAMGAQSLDHPLVFVMSRLRTVPVPPRYDEELRIARTFQLPTARAFGFTGVARLDPDAPEAALDELLGLVPVSAGGVSATSNGHMAGDVRVRAASAIDGDPHTAWTAPFATPVGSAIQVRTPEPVTFDHLDLQIVADGRHTVPRQLLLEVDGEQRTIDLPAIEDRKVQDATVDVPVTFDPVTGSAIKLTVLDSRQVLTKEYYSGALAATPIAIAELGIPGVQVVADDSATLGGACRTDLMTVDGASVGVTVTGTRDDAAARGELDVQLCDTELALGAGEHTLRTKPGRTTGIDLDRLVFSSASGGGVAPVGPAATLATPDAPVGPRVDVTDFGRTKVKLTVHDANDPFWLVLGESVNAGWKATVDGKDVGGSTLVNGYANGWRIDPARGDVNVVLEWTPQRVVWASLVFSALALLVCGGIFLVSGIRDRRRKARDWRVQFVGPPELRSPRIATGSRPSTTGIVTGSVFAGLVAGGVVRPWVGILVGVLTAIVLVRPRFRLLLTAAPPTLLAASALYIMAKQWHVKYPPFFEWPTFFEAVHILGWLAVVLIAADAWVEVLRTRPRSKSSS